ncbi:MAG: arsenate reductase [Saprospiraceae bacterium]|jgi:arsenate reductase
MRKIYHLSTCNTCQRIIKELGGSDGFEMQDIKTEKITGEQLDAMKAKVGTYEDLFSRRSRQYAARGLKEQVLTEDDYRSLILEEYTFLKRPVIWIDGEIFVGNNKKVTAAAVATLS